jgi:hypothetical protein
MADKHQETQEQSIKARKHQLFDDDTSEFAVKGPRKPFEEFLKETSAAPLSGTAKAILWAAGVVVVLLLVAAMLKGLRGHSKTGPRPTGKSTVMSAVATRTIG